MRQFSAPNGLPALIGSMPHKEPNRPLTHILNVAPEIPSWPQLPERSWREGFIAQYSESLPGIQWDMESETFHINRSSDDFPDAMTSFYSDVFETEETSNYSAFQISSEAAAGFYAAIDVFSALKKKPPYIKIHTTGPISHGLTLMDDHDTPVFYEDDYRDVLIRNCIMKSLWQAEAVSHLSENIICFIDEPVLSSYGSSAYIGVTRDLVVDTLSPVVEALKHKGIIAGVHVCGNTEWDMLIETGFDILNPDVYGHGDGFLLYGDHIISFMRKGGVVAWGIVPTFLYTPEVTVNTLMERMDRFIASMKSKGIPNALFLQQSMLTPSCGLGSLSVENAEGVMKLLEQFAEAIQTRFDSE